MKKINLLFLMLLIAAGITAQNYVIDFHYDDAGNREERIRREITLPPQPEQAENISEEELEEQLAKIETEFGFETLGEGKISVFPNPVRGELKINLVNMPDVLGAEAKLYSLRGNLLETQRLSNNYSSFDMKNYSPGVYILRITKNNESREYKIVKE